MRIEKRLPRLSRSFLGEEETIKIDEEGLASSCGSSKWWWRGWKKRGKWNYRANKSKLKKDGKKSHSVPEMREGVRGVIESSLYQIMTGAILSVLGRCSVCAFVPCFSLCCTLAERTKSNDESNSIMFPSLPSHSPSHVSPSFLLNFFPLRRIGESSSGVYVCVHQR